MRTPSSAPLRSAGSLRHVTVPHASPFRHAAAMLVVLGLGGGARAQQVPQAHVPGSVLLEVSLLERAFDTALAADCAPDRCFSKGCVYGHHTTIDLPKTSSLPGLPTEEGLGSVVPQDYLTEARCELTYEKTAEPKDIQALTRRLQQRLSHGWLKVVVSAQALEPVSPALAANNTDDAADNVDAGPALDDPAAAATVPAEPEWTAGTALRELWLGLLPHFPWMIAIFLLTLASFVIIWAARRLGALSIEERLLLAQPPEPAAATPPAAEASPAASEQKQEEERSFAEQQEREWTERIKVMEGGDDDVVTELLREWLKADDFPMLARALFVFGDRLSHAFASDGDLALKKLKFAEYFRDVEEQSLPSRAEFFRRLNQHAMASMLLAQEDVQLFRALREDFGSSGILSLMDLLPDRFSALLYTLVPQEVQHDVARLMSSAMRNDVATQLLTSTRISKEESAFVFACVGAARDGKPLPAAPAAQITDRGPSVDAAAALSVLLPHLSVAERRALFRHALERGGGNAPQWFEDIFFGEMLSKLTPEMRNDLLLDVDVRALAAWLSLQDQEWQRAFTASLSVPMQNALRGNAGFASRHEQVVQARKGHQELTRSLKAQYAKGRAAFVELVA